MTTEHLPDFNHCNNVAQYYAYLDKYTHEFKDMPGDILSHRKIAMHAVMANSSNIEYVADDFKVDKNFIIICISHAQTGIATVLQHIDDSLKNDSQFMMQVVQERISVLDFPKVVEQFTQLARSTKEFAYFIVNKNHHQLDFCTYNWQEDADIMYLAVAKKKTFTFFSEVLKNNLEFIQDIVVHQPEYILLASERIKNDPDIMVPILEKHGTIFEHCSEIIRHDKICVEYATKTYPMALLYTSESLRSDRNFIQTLAIDGNSQILKYCDNALLNDASWCMHILIERNIYKYLPREILNHKDIIHIILEKYPQEMIRKGTTEHYADHDLLIKALKRCATETSAQYLPDALRKNKDFMMRLVDEIGCTFYTYAHHDLLDDIDFTMYAFEKLEKLQDKTSDNRYNERKIYMTNHIGSNLKAMIASSGMKVMQYLNAYKLQNELNETLPQNNNIRRPKVKV